MCVCVCVCVCACVCVCVCVESWINQTLNSDLDVHISFGPYFILRNFFKY